MVYDLLHPEDSLTLRIVGIFIDPTHEKVPLHFRLNFALKRTLLMSPLSAAIMNHLCENVQVWLKIYLMVKLKCSNLLITLGGKIKIVTSWRYPSNLSAALQ